MRSLYKSIIARRSMSLNSINIFSTTVLPGSLDTIYRID